jgi:hypothetical protein
VSKLPARASHFAHGRVGWLVTEPAKALRASVSSNWRVTFWPGGVMTVPHDVFLAGYGARKAPVGAVRHLRQRTAVMNGARCFAPPAPKREGLA